MRPETAQAQVNRLKKRWTNREHLRLYHEVLQDAYEGYWARRQPKNPDEPSWHADPTRRPPFGPNIVYQIVSMLSGLYDREPLRIMAGDSESDQQDEQEWARDRLWEWGNGLSAGMAEGVDMATLHGVVLLGVYWRPTENAATDIRRIVLERRDAALESMQRPDGEEIVRYGDESGPPAQDADLAGTSAGGSGDGAEEGASIASDMDVDLEGLNLEEQGIEVLPILPFDFEVLPNENDPRRIEAVIVRIGETKCAQTTGRESISHAERDKDISDFHYWDSKYYARLRNFEPVPIGPGGEKFIEHNFGVIPFVPVRWRQTSRRFWVSGKGGYDFLGNIYAIGRLWREYMFTAALQRGQPYVKGDLKEQPTLSPDAIVKVSEKGDFGIRKNEADLQGMLDAIEFATDAVGQSLGLPKGALRVEVSAAESGIAIALRRAQLDGERVSVERLARGAERQVHRVAAAVWNAVSGDDRLGKLDSIRFQQPLQVLTQDEELRRQQFAYSAGVLSRTDLAREMYPNDSPEALESRIERAEEERADIETAPAQE